MTITKPIEKGVLTHTKQLIASETAKGKTQVEIAEVLNITQSGVSKHMQKPEVIELTERLRNTLKERHVAKFIQRTIKTEKQISKLNDYALGLSDDNPTRYTEIADIDKALIRADRNGMAVLKGVGILDTNTININSNNNEETTVISPSFQAFIDFQSSKQIENSPDSPDYKVIDVDAVE